jgi:hypothetical protein
MQFMLIYGYFTTGILKSSVYDYAIHDSCDYHKELDNKECAKGLARRLCFMLSKVLCPMFGITPTQNHLPLKIQVNAETYTGVLHDVKPLPVNRYHQNVGTDDSQWKPNEDMADEEANSPIPQTGIGRGRPNASKSQNNSF